MDQIKRFSTSMPEGIDAVLIRSAPNRTYFTGLRSMGGTLLFTKSQAYLIIDSRYIEIAQATITNCKVILEETLSQQLPKLLDELRVKVVGTETSHLSYDELRRLEEMISPAKLSYDSATSQAILRQRRTKTQEEISCLEAAQDITDRAFSDNLHRFYPGARDLDIAVAIGESMARYGSEKRSFDFIFTSGPNTSLPHGNRGNREIQPGDFVMMDMGSVINGYGSDMTRTVAVGSVSDEQKKVYDIVLEAQQRALDCIRPGVLCREVDAAARSYICSKGYGNFFGHGLGHSLGVEIHEDPRFNKESAEVLEEGLVMTVEPGIYLPGRFGVRIEDMIVVTKDGYRNLTKSAKHLLELGK